MNEYNDDFAGACGYAAAMAASLWRPLEDLTGTFSPDECEELVARAMIKLAVDEVMGC